jgi:NADH-quinone oxidoreductase subunit E
LVKTVPDDIITGLQQKVEAEEFPRELAVEVLQVLQKHYGYLSEEALRQASDLLGLTLLELDELVTFYDFLYRQPVGEYVLHVCDSTLCWMFGHQSILDYLSRKLEISPGETTVDGLFSLLPVCCLGYCDHAPAMMVNGRLYGPLTPSAIDDILNNLKRSAGDRLGEEDG